MINKYTGGCLSLQTVLRYLEERNEEQAYQYEAERGRVDQHLEGCENCKNRIQIFIERYGPGDDPTKMIF